MGWVKSLPSVNGMSDCSARVDVWDWTFLFQVFAHSEMGSILKSFSWSLGVGLEMFILKSYIDPKRYIPHIVSGKSICWGIHSKFYPIGKRVLKSIWINAFCLCYESLQSTVRSNSTRVSTSNIFIISPSIRSIIDCYGLSAVGEIIGTE